MSSAICFNLDQFEILSSGNELIMTCLVQYIIEMHLTSFSQNMAQLKKMKKRAFENINESGESAGNQHFLLITFLCPHTKRSGAYCFTVVHPSVCLFVIFLFIRLSAQT